MFYSVTLEPSSQDPARDQSSLGGSTDGQSSPRTLTVSAQRDGLLGIPEGHPTAPRAITFTIPTKKNSPSPRFFVGPSASGLGLLDSTLADGELKLDGQVAPIPAGPDFASDMGSIGPDILWAPYMKQAVTTGQPVLIDLPAQALVGTEKRGWGEHARQALVVPIIVPGTGGVEVGHGMGTCKLVLILGINSRRPYDSDYEGWIDVLGGSLGQMYAGVTSREADNLRAVQLAQLDAAKTHFFSNASHELRTPLTLIAGPINDVLVEATCSRTQERLKLAMRNVNRLRKLVDTLMDFSRVEAGRLEGHFRPVNLGAVTADLAALFRSAIEKSGIQFEVDCDVGSKQLTYVDPELWEKILFNLVGNAFKYTLIGRIMVSIKYIDGFAVFSVTDTGVGIPSKDRLKICERFHRVAVLLVTSQTIEDSPTGENGSTFTVQLPLGKAHLPDGHVHDEQVEHVSSFFGRDWSYARTFVEEVTQWATQGDSTPETTSEGPESLSSLNSARVDPAIYFAKTDKILIGARVLVAKDGIEALEIARAEVPNLVLSDVMMPGLDGLQFIAALRSSNETSLIPVILVTAQAGVEGRVEGLLSGADDVICKPFQSRELLARANLHTQLGKRRVELETKFNERTEELKIVTESSPVAFFRINSDREVVFANAKYYELTGQARDLGSLDWYDLTPPLGHPRESSYHPLPCGRLIPGPAYNLSICKRQLTSGSGLSTSVKGAQLIFNGVWVKAQVVPTSLGIIGTLTDISAQKLYEESQLAHAQEREMLAKRRAEEADEQLLIDVTSHELRQPVSAILNSAQLIRSNLVDLRQALRANDGQQIDPKHVAALEDDIESLDAVMQCGLAQERIANDVLSLSRIQLQVRRTRFDDPRQSDTRDLTSARLRPKVLAIHPTEFVLADEIQNIVSIFKNETKMQVAYSLSNNGVSTVFADKARFAQIVTNLCSNAIRFTDLVQGERTIVVTVDVSPLAPAEGSPCVPPKREYSPGVVDPQRMFVYVSVADSGPGVHPDDVALLFKRFQQGTNSHEVFGGSGLGLFVSRQLATLMGGKIDVSSKIGNGATFRFFIEATLPGPTKSDPAESVERPGGVPRRIKALRRPSGTRDPRHVGVHILITEDNQINQSVLKLVAIPFSLLESIG
ncbi:hypothetical protein FRC10_010933 [Ceratobasidium sp. 414]|nr:hypothetical protein FRC10_010933 [Ceratobasidium sp. 414]